MWAQNVNSSTFLCGIHTAMFPGKTCSGGCARHEARLQEVPPLPFHLLKKHGRMWGRVFISMWQEGSLPPGGQQLPQVEATKGSTWEGSFRLGSLRDPLSLTQCPSWAYLLYTRSQGATDPDSISHSLPLAHAHTSWMYKFKCVQGHNWWSMITEEDRRGIHKSDCLMGIWETEKREIPKVRVFSTVLVRGAAVWRSPKCLEYSISA